MLDSYEGELGHFCLNLFDRELCCRLKEATGVLGKGPVLDVTLYMKHLTKDHVT